MECSRKILEWCRKILELFLISVLRRISERELVGGGVGEGWGNRKKQRFSGRNVGAVGKKVPFLSENFGASRKKMEVFGKNWR